jgi:hypothetical protein
MLDKEFLGVTKMNPEKTQRISRQSQTGDFHRNTDRAEFNQILCYKPIKKRSLIGKI